MRDPDRELVTQAKRGDKTAFAELVEHYYEMVYVVSYGVLNNREESKDAAQEVFIKVYKQLKKFKGDSKFKTWLYRIAVNASIDYARKKKPAEDIDNVKHLSSGARGPREEASRAERREMVREGLEKLSPEHRMVLVLKEWHHMSYEEIASVMKIEKGTVMSRIHYAKQALGKVLGVHLKEPNNA